MSSERFIDGVEIRDNVSEFSEEEESEDEVGEGSETDVNQSRVFWSQVDYQEMHNLDYPDGYGNRGSGSTSVNDLEVGMHFESKEATINAIKQWHIQNSYDYVVDESRPDRYVGKCKKFGSGCNWRIRASFNKRKDRWEIRKIDGVHSCTSSLISQDHKKLTSDVIANCVIGLVSADPGIRIKTLIAEVRNNFHYTVTYKKAWKAKQIALAKAFGDWETSYAELPKWMDAVQQCLPGTIVKYRTLPLVVNGMEDPYSVIVQRVFWSFKPCIEGFAYCKPIVQVDGTFLTGKYRGTLLVAIAQDGNRNLLPVAFAIVEGETKEAWAWFLYNLRTFVTPQPNLCVISDRGKGLLAALGSQRVGWVEQNAHSVFCIRHIASNFNKHFHNNELKDRVIKMAYELRQPRFEAKLLTMRSEFRQAAEWLDKIPKEKWTQAYDGGKRFGHMTTNLAECINSVMKGARALPITALVKTTFYRLSQQFVDKGSKAISMMKAGHIFCEELSSFMQKNRQQASSHYVRRYTRETGEFEVQEFGRTAMVCKVKLQEWWCDCGEFQAFRFPCSHVIAACSYCNLDCNIFINPVYRLDYIFKVYEQEFHPVGNEGYWAPYSGPIFYPDPAMLRVAVGRPKTARITNEMDIPIPNKPKKCGFCRSEGHNRSQCPYKV